MTRFERELEEEAPSKREDRGNRWYFFLPLGMVGFWLLVAPGRLVAMVLSQSSYGRADPSHALDGLLDAVDVIGGLGWLLLFPFYLLLLSRKRASGWWALGAFCWGLNVPLYIVLLLLPARRYSALAVAKHEPQLLDASDAPRSPTYLLKDSFICESCDALLNYGVSACDHCGERYKYVNAEPLVDDAPRR